MNTLTKNRIIEKGDEYLDRESWKPVTPDQCGLQVMFSRYTVVRRPSEKSSLSNIDKIDVTISPKASNTKDGQASPSPKATAKAEAKPVPASGVSPAGGESLPTVISPRAHISDEEAKATTRAALSAVVAMAKMHKHHVETDPSSALVPPTVKANGSFQAVYPDNSTAATAAGLAEPIWIGRNGTFKAKALNMHNLGGIIRIVPVGKRGTAKNALIEFPVEIIPQMVDWLLRHQITTK